MNEPDIRIPPVTIPTPPRIGMLPDFLRETEQAMVPDDDSDAAPASSTAEELHYNSGGLLIDIDAGGFRYNDGAIVIDIDGTNGIKLTNGSVVVRIADSGDFTFTDGTNLITMSPNGDFSISNGTHSLYVDPALITHDMGIKTFSGCNSGSPGDYLTLASDFLP